MKSVTDEWYCCSSLKRHLIFSIKLKNRTFSNIHQPHNCGTQNISNIDFTGDWIDANPSFKSIFHIYGERICSLVKKNFIMCSWSKHFEGAWTDLIFLIAFSTTFLHTTIRRPLFKCFLLNKCNTRYPSKLGHCEEFQSKLPTITQKN